MIKRKNKPKIIMTSNTLWFIYNFNLSLIEQLRIKNEIIIVAPFDEYYDSLKNYVDKIINIDINSKGVNPIGNTVLSFKYYEIFKEINPDIILSYTIKPNIFGNFAAKSLQIPVINTITGLGTIFIKENLTTKIGKLLYRFALKSSAHTFFLNTTDQNTFTNINLICSKLTSIVPGSGISTTNFNTDRNTNKGQIFLFVGRLIGDKGIRECIDAFKEVLRTHPNLELRLAGESNCQNKTAIDDRELQEWLMIPQVKYLGKTDNIMSELEDADVMILPSYREGLSRSLLEAAAMKLPIITTNVPGCIEVVQHNHNGFLCDPKDSNDLANQIKKMIGLKESERIEMGMKGRVLVENEFADRIVNKVYTSKINELIPQA